MHHLHAHFTDTFESNHNHNWQFYLVFFFALPFFLACLESCCAQCSCNSNVFWRIFKEELLYFLLDLLFFLDYGKCVRLRDFLHKYSMKIEECVGGRACNYKFKCLWVANRLCRNGCNFISDDWSEILTDLIAIGLCARKKNSRSKQKFIMDSLLVTNPIRILSTEIWLDFFFHPI